VGKTLASADVLPTHHTQAPGVWPNADGRLAQADSGSLAEPMNGVQLQTHSMPEVSKVRRVPVSTF